LNRLVQKSYPDTATVNYTSLFFGQTGSTKFVSRLTQVTDPTGTYQFTFDNMGRLTGTATQYALLPSRTLTTAYSYDKASNRTGFTDPENGSTSYAYDTLNRLQTLTPPVAISGGSFGFGYDVLSRRTSLTRPNAVNTAYSYDNLSRLLSVTHTKGGVTLDGATYTLDNAGNRTAKSDLNAGVTTNYGYDNIYQLLSATQSGATTESYTYDSVGNRLSSLAGSGWTYDTSNQLNSQPSASYTYDANGNTTSKTDSTGTTTYAWDYDNRFTSVTLPGSSGTVSYRYDAFGRRIYKSSTVGTSVYAYDNDNLIEETNATGAAVARYTQTQNLDEPLAILRSGTTSYYEADGSKSITSLSNAAGTLTQAYTFDAFGNQTASSGSLTNPFRFAGRELDSDTNLYFLRARFYDAGAGRFITEDPIAFRGGDVNLYRYVWNRPTSFVDPRGKRGVGVAGGASAGAGLGIGAAGTVGGGVGVFGGGGNGVSTGAFGGGGVIIGGGDSGWEYPADYPDGSRGWSNPDDAVVGGAFAGAGIGAFYTNATSVCQLKGPFDTLILDVGPLEFQWGRSGDISIFSLTYGVSRGLGATIMQPNTTSVKPLSGSKCGCQ